MKTVLLAALLIALSTTTEVTNAKGLENVPTEKTPPLRINTTPKKVQQAFKDATELGGLTFLNTPVWTREDGLYTVTVRATGEFGPGTCAMRFKSYGGMMFCDFTADDPNYYETKTNE